MYGGSTLWSSLGRLKDRQANSFIDKIIPLSLDKILRISGIEKEFFKVMMLKKMRRLVEERESRNKRDNCGKERRAKKCNEKPHEQKKESVDERGR